MGNEERKDTEKIIEEARAEVLPFESWERLAGESSAAYAAFVVFRDYGPQRNIKRALEKTEPGKERRDKRYRMWRGWSMKFRWFRRAEDYDRYLDRLKLAERRKTIEKREEAYRSVTGKMLAAVEKKLEVMRPEELSQSSVTEWAKTAIGTEREIFGLAAQKDKREEGGTQREINFTQDFEGV
jgi:hypothetical protein